MEISIRVGMGEAYDRLTILKIKLQKIEDPDKLTFVRNEWSELLDMLASHLIQSDVSDMYQQLYQVNERLWLIEDNLREIEREGKFDENFIEYARLVYKLNDQRASIKQKINKYFGSNVKEVKSYKSY